VNSTARTAAWDAPEDALGDAAVTRGVSAKPICGNEVANKAAKVVERSASVRAPENNLLIVHPVSVVWSCVLIGWHFRPAASIESSSSANSLPGLPILGYQTRLSTNVSGQNA
jgi:hypothetical protein